MIDRFLGRFGLINIYKPPRGNYFNMDTEISKTALIDKIFIWHFKSEG